MFYAQEEFWAVCWSVFSQCDKFYTSLDHCSCSSVLFHTLSSAQLQPLWGGKGGELNDYSEFTRRVTYYYYYLPIFFLLLFADHVTLRLVLEIFVWRQKMFKHFPIFRYFPSSFLIFFFLLSVSLIFSFIFFSKSSFPSSFLLSDFYTLSRFCHVISFFFWYFFSGGVPCSFTPLFLVIPSVFLFFPFLNLFSFSLSILPLCFIFFPSFSKVVIFPCLSHTCPFFLPWFLFLFLFLFLFSISLIFFLMLSFYFLSSFDFLFFPVINHILFLLSTTLPLILTYLLGFSSFFCFSKITSLLHPSLIVSYPFPFLSQFFFPPIPLTLCVYFFQDTQI